MLGTLVVVVMKEDWSFGSDQSSHPHVLIGQLSRFDLPTRSFSVLGLSEVDIEIDRCAALRRMSDSADLLPQLRGAAPQPVRDFGNDTFIILSVRPRFLAFACQLRARSLQDDSVVIKRNDGRRERYGISRCLAIEHFADGAQEDICAQFELARPRIEEAARQEARRQAERAVHASLVRHAAEDSWLMHERRRREEAQAHAREEEARRRAERMNMPELRESRARLAELLAEYRVRQKESPVETSLRRVIAGSHESVVEHTTCVALTDAERKMIRRASIAKLMHAPRAMCWSRAVYPGLDVGEFIFGTAPPDRQQYVVRYPMADARVGDSGGVEVEPTDESDSASPAAWKFGAPAYTLHRHRCESMNQSMWSFDGSIPPPGYPVTTLYEKRVQNITSCGSLGRAHGAARKRAAMHALADRESLHRQKFYATNNRSQNDRLLGRDTER